MAKCSSVMLLLALVALAHTTANAARDVPSGTEKKGLDDQKTVGIFSGMGAPGGGLPAFGGVGGLGGLTVPGGPSLGGGIGGLGSLGGGDGGLGGLGGAGLGGLGGLTGGNGLGGLGSLGGLGGGAGGPTDDAGSGSGSLPFP